MAEAGPGGPARRRGPPSAGVRLQAGSRLPRTPRSHRGLASLRRDAPAGAGNRRSHSRAPSATGWRGNRFAIQPMEGWDGTGDGMPTDHVRRRWRNFGRSGAKLIWGGEAFRRLSGGEGQPQPADGLRLDPGRSAGAPGDPDRRPPGSASAPPTTSWPALQLTHSGRFCRPFSKDRMEPFIAYRHPILDRRFGLDPGRTARHRRLPAAADRALRRSGLHRPATPGSISSTSSTATVISATSC